VGPRGESRGAGPGFTGARGGGDRARFRFFWAVLQGFGGAGAERGGRLGWAPSEGGGVGGWVEAWARWGPKPREAGFGGAGKTWAAGGLFSVQEGGPWDGAQCSGPPLGPKRPVPAGTPPKNHFGCLGSLDQKNRPGRHLWGFWRLGTAQKAGAGRPIEFLRVTCPQGGVPLLVGTRKGKRVGGHQRGGGKQRFFFGFPAWAGPHPGRFSPAGGPRPGA